METQMQPFARQRPFSYCWGALLGVFMTLLVTYQVVEFRAIHMEVKRDQLDAQRLASIPALRHIRKADPLMLEVDRNLADGSLFRAYRTWLTSRQWFRWLTLDSWELRLLLALLALGATVVVAFLAYQHFVVQPRMMRGFARAAQHLQQRQHQDYDAAPPLMLLEQQQQHSVDHLSLPSNGREKHHVRFDTT